MKRSNVMSYYPILIIFWMLFGLESNCLKLAGSKLQKKFSSPVRPQRLSSFSDFHSPKSVHPSQESVHLAPRSVHPQGNVHQSVRPVLNQWFGWQTNIWQHISNCYHMALTYWISCWEHRVHNTKSYASGWTTRMQSDIMMDWTHNLSTSTDGEHV